MSTKTWGGGSLVLKEWFLCHFYLVKKLKLSAKRLENTILVFQNFVIMLSHFVLFRLDYLSYIIKRNIPDFRSVFRKILTFLSTYLVKKITIFFVGIFSFFFFFDETFGVFPCHYIAPLSIIITFNDAFFFRLKVLRTVCCCW